MNGVAMARHGLILWENEATGSRKVFRYLPDLRDAILNLKMTAKVQTYQSPVNYCILLLLLLLYMYIYIYIYIYTALFGVSRWDHI